jgi:hypothetical protein
MVIDRLILTQYIVTAVSSGFNAAYFSGYRSPLRRRRVGALVLALLSVAILTESIYFTCFSLSYIYNNGNEFLAGLLLTPVPFLVVRLLLCLGSLLVSVLILRHLLNRRR